MAGLPFSLTLLTILMAHELGHYLACVYYGIDASLPVLSAFACACNLGHVWRIHSDPLGYSQEENSIRYRNRGADRSPASCFCFRPWRHWVSFFQKCFRELITQGTIQLGVPALEWLAEKLIFPGVQPADIYLHPVARAAWVGMFATALNLLPAGQLDGGHVVYALLGRSQRWITNIFLVALVPMGKFWTGWWFWAVILFFFARKHPPLYDSSAIGESRVKLGIVALCIFILCFSLTPINE